MTSDRTPYRGRDKTPESRMTTDFSKFNVNDSFCNFITDASSGGERRRLSR